MIAFGFGYRRRAARPPPSSAARQLEGVNGNTFRPEKMIKAAINFN
jgi:hypothetical protein